MTTAGRPEQDSLSSIFELARGRLAREPLLKAVRDAATVDVQQFLRGKPLGQTLAELASRDKFLEDALLEMAERASTTVRKGLEDETRVAEAERRADADYRRGLLRRLERKPLQATADHEETSGDYVLHGSLHHPSKNEPLAGLVVEVMRRDGARSEILGLALTDERGDFDIRIDSREFPDIFAEANDNPDIVVRVSLDRRNVLDINESSIRPKPGRRARVKIKLQENCAAVLDKIQVGSTELDEERLVDLNEQLYRQRIQHEMIQQVGGVVSAGLHEAIDMLKVRIDTYK